MTADPRAWQPLGRALRDYAAGQLDAAATVILEDGDRLPLPIAVFFRTPAQFPDAETAALALCAGRVLDVGAGAGSHALALAARGLEVTALDVCAAAVAVMRRRGVATARVGDVFRASFDRRFDTLLLLMNGIGLVGDLAGLDRFLDRAAELLAPDGQVLLDSSDPRDVDDPSEVARMVERVRRGLYRGATRQQIEYRGRVGAPFPWLYLDPDTLAARAAARGWYCQVVYNGEDGAYAARLRHRG